MGTRALLSVSAFVEVGAAGALLGVPSWTATMLLGEGLSAPPAIVVARVAGAAVLSLAIACWRGRNGDFQSSSSLVAAMLGYNIAVFVVLMHGWFAYSLDGIGLWPAISLHSALALWCVTCLRPARSWKTK